MHPRTSSHKYKLPLAKKKARNFSSYKYHPSSHLRKKNVGKMYETPLELYLYIIPHLAKMGSCIRCNARIFLKRVLMSNVIGDARFTPSGGVRANSRCARVGARHFWNAVSSARSTFRYSIPSFFLFLSSLSLTCSFSYFTVRRAITLLRSRNVSDDDGSKEKLCFSFLWLDHIQARMVGSAYVWA